MSTLAAQLKQLQIPGLHKDVSKPQHVSILFDKNVAATLDMESIYNVGVSGFDQMMTIEPILIDYQELLFSQKSIHLQRTMEDKSFNKKISKAIEEFLLSYKQLRNVLNGWFGGLRSITLIETLCYSVSFLIMRHSCLEGSSNSFTKATTAPHGSIYYSS